MAESRQRRQWGSVRQERSGRWRAQYRPEPGAPYIGAPATFAKRGDAERWLERTRVHIEEGDYRDHRLGQETVAEFAEEFMQAHAERLARTSAARVAGLWALHVEPTFGKRRLREVRTSQVRSWIAGLTREGLAPSSVRQAFILLSQVFAAAVDDGAIPANPCTGARKSLPRLPEPEPTIIKPEQVEVIAENMGGEAYRLIVNLLAYSGARIGEVLALRRRSVDVMRGRLIITEGVTEVAGHQHVGDTKTHQRRVVTIPGWLTEALRHHLTVNVELDPEAFLFSSRNGNPIRYRSVRRHWDRAVEAAGLPGLRLHDLRASHLSWVAARYGVLVAGARAGHSTASVTTRHYSRPLEGQDAEVADWLGTLRPAATMEGDTGTA